jgi:hypothetical protein
MKQNERPDYLDARKMHSRLRFPLTSCYATLARRVGINAPTHWPNSF